MPWKIDKSRRVTLERFGLPEFWIKINSPLAGLYGDSQAAANDDVGLGVMAKYILAWNLTDPETDEPLTVPTEKEFESMSRLPIAVILMIRDIIMEEAEDVVKKETVTGSETTSSQQREAITSEQASNLFGMPVSPDG